MSIEFQNNLPIKKECDHLETTETSETKEEMTPGSTRKRTIKYTQRTCKICGEDMGCSMEDITEP
jgi:hypothetical protein